MSAARASPLRPGLSKTCARQPTMVDARRASKAARPKRNGARAPPGVCRLIPDGVIAFFMPDGRLLTSADNVRFLLDHNIDHDNAKARNFAPVPELRKLCSQYHVRLAFARQHILHPHDVRYFEPRGHPLGAMIRAKYGRKARDEPLWVFCTGAGAKSNLVATLTRRRLVGALHGALEDRGFSLAPGLAPDREIRGTLWLNVHNPVKTGAQPAVDLARAVAAALDSYCSRPR